MLNLLKKLFSKTKQKIEKTEAFQEQRKASFEREFNRWGKMKTESPKFLR